MFKSMKQRLHRYKGYDIDVVTYFPFLFYLFHIYFAAIITNVVSQNNIYDYCQLIDLVVDILFGR